jgi:hypothetical protein
MIIDCPGQAVALAGVTGARDTDAPLGDYPQRARRGGSGATYDNTRPSLRAQERPRHALSEASCWPAIPAALADATARARERPVGGADPRVLGLHSTYNRGDDQPRHGGPGRIRLEGADRGAPFLWTI